MLRCKICPCLVHLRCAFIAILGVLWLAEGVLGAHKTLQTFENDNCDFLSPITQQVCNETQVLVGISFAAWIVREYPVPLPFGGTLCISVFSPLTPPPPAPAVHTYAITILVFALLNRSRGAPVWTSSVGRHTSVVPVGYSAPQNAMPLVTTQPQPNQCPAQGVQQMPQLSNAAPTLAPSSQGGSDAPPQVPGPYGRPVIDSVPYMESTESVGYHGHPQL